MRSKLKVLMLPTMNSGTSYYRLYQFKESMNRQKIASVAMPWYDSQNDQQAEWQWYADKDWTLSGVQGELCHLIKQADVIIVQYVHTPQALALIEAFKATFQDWRIEARYGRKVFLAEIDDDVLDTPPWNAAFDQYRPQQQVRNNVIAFLQSMDGVITSTPFLAEKYKELNKHVYVVKNCIDLRRWDKYANERSKKQIRIGWAGGGTHSEDLRTIEGPVKEVLAKSKGVTFHILNGCPEFFKNQDKIVFHPHYYWINEYPRGLKRLKFDIGLAPLVDCDFNRGKSNLRKLEYAAMSIPVVAADVGELASTVKHGVDGLLYKDSAGFMECLERLIADARLRADMGRKNYDSVKADFNTDAVSRDYVAVLQGAHERGQTVKIDVSKRQPAGAFR